MSADHFFGYALDHVVHGEAVFFCGDLCVHDHLQQHVAQLFAEVSVVFVIDGFQHFAGFFHKALFQAFVGLLDVPGASAGRPELSYDLAEICKVVAAVGVVSVKLFVIHRGYLLVNQHFLDFLLVFPPAYSSGQAPAAER